MRGLDQRTGELFSYVDLEARVRPDHPLRPIRAVVNEALAALEGEFAPLYAGVGRPSIPPEKLLRAMLLQAFYSIRSERQLMERLDYDLLFRWFVGLGIDDPAWDHSTFSKNRDRLLDGDIAAITSLGSVIQESTLACISNGVGGGLMSNAVWKGVPLRRLLEAAGTRTGAVEVVLHGVDGYVDTFPLAKAMDETTLVAYEMNGEPLPRRHGYPVRIIVPGLYGEKNVKWIDRIEVSKTNEKGFYENQGWGPDFTVQTQSRFTAPAFDRPLAAAPMMLRGTAFAGDRGVSKVEVSADDGATWQPATIDYAGTRLTWNLWSYQWTPTRQGDHRLVVRATDGAGNLQTDKDRTSGPEGATGLHKITAKVT